MKLPADKVSRLKSFYEERPVCVTGGAGFIGGHLCDALLSLGATIRVIDDLSNSTLDHLSELIELEPDRVRFVHGSILEDKALDEALEGAATVFHLGAMGSVPRSVEAPARTWAVNATGTLRVLESARRAGAARVVGASSSSIYGNQPELPKRETQLPRPLSPYAASKLALEHLFLSYASCYTLSTVSLRYFNVFGPRQRADSQYAAVVPAFTKRLLAGEPPIIHGDGLQTRDFTFVANAVLATLLAGSTTTPLKGEAVNVASGVQATLLDCALKLATICQAPPHLQPTHAPERAGDVRHSVADISLAKSLLGYEPVCSFEEGLAETVEWSRHEADAAGT